MKVEHRYACLTISSCDSCGNEILQLSDGSWYHNFSGAAYCPLADRKSMDVRFIQFHGSKMIAIYPYRGEA